MGPIEQSLRERAVASRLRLFKSSRRERPVPLLVEQAPEVISEPVAAPPRRKATTVKGIILEVCERHGVTYDELLSMSRRPHIVRCRQECCYVLRHSDIRVLGKKISLPSIGRHLGGLDHTTVIYAIRKHAHLSTDQYSLDEALDRGCAKHGERVLE